MWQIARLHLVKELGIFFFILVPVHLDKIPINNQPDAQFSLYIYIYIFIYFDSVHVSNNLVLIIRRVNCINTTSGICHSV